MRSATVVHETAVIGRQRELQQLHRQLRSVLQDMDEMKPKIEEDFEEDFDDFEVSPTNQTSARQEIRLLIREIQRLQIDVADVQGTLLSKPKDQRITKMIAQLTELSHVLDGQLYRAEKLIQ